MKEGKNIMVLYNPGTTHGIYCALLDFELVKSKRSIFSPLVRSLWMHSDAFVAHTHM